MEVFPINVQVFLFEQLCFHIQFNVLLLNSCHLKNIKMCCQHQVSRPGEASSEARCDPGHGETSEAVAPQTQTQPLPHQV